VASGTGDHHVQDPYKEAKRRSQREGAHSQEANSRDTGSGKQQIRDHPRASGAKGGASIAELSEATGWQTHSVRGFLSGTLRKKLGLTVISAKEDGGRRYRLEPGSDRP